MSVYSVDQMSSVRQPRIRSASGHGSVYNGSERSVRTPSRQGSINANYESDPNSDQRHWGTKRRPPLNRINFVTERGMRRTADRVAGRVFIREITMPVGGTQVTEKKETWEWIGGNEGGRDWHRTATISEEGKISWRDGQKKDWFNFVEWPKTWN